MAEAPRKRWELPKDGWRELATLEIAVIEKLCDLGFPGNEIARRQITGALAHPVECCGGGGCGSIYIRVDSPLVLPGFTRRDPPQHDARILYDATCSNEGLVPVDVILYANSDGQICELEFVHYVEIRHPPVSSLDNLGPYQGVYLNTLSSISQDLASQSSLDEFN